MSYLHHQPYARMVHWTFIAATILLVTFASHTTLTSSHTIISNGKGGKHVSPLTGTLGDDVTPTVLAAGWPITDAVESNAWKYYSIDCTNRGGKALTVSVTPVGSSGSGDPDLYLDFNTQNPTTQAQFSANSWTADSITLTAQDYSGHDTAYIGVYGWGAVAFSILASFEDVVNLANGVPISGYVPNEGDDFFTFTVDSVSTGGTKKDVFFAVSTSAGRADLFIGNSRQPIPADTASYQWMDQRQGAGEFVRVKATDSQYPTDGKFYITIAGASQVSYTVVVSTSDVAVELRDGVAQHDEIVSTPTRPYVTTPRYYHYQVNDVNCTVTFTVTPMSGDPDIYVSRTVQRPNATSNERASESSFGDDVVTYYHPAPTGNYWIAVDGAEGPASYTILAHSECTAADPLEAAIVLQDGLPQNAYLAEGRTRYYKIRVVDDTTSLQVTLTTRQGDPDLYVTTGGPTPPGPEHYYWRSIFWGDDVVDIRPTTSSGTPDPHWCTQCYFYIAVFASSNCSYTIRASPSGGIITLQDGVSVSGGLFRGDSKYYQISLNTWDRPILTIALTSLSSGDPDLFVGRQPYPNATTAIWKSNQWGADTVTIPETDANYCTFCTYYITVFAYTDMLFSLVASFDQAVWLEDGKPQHGRVGANGMFYFNYWPLDFNQDVTITLSTTSGLTELLVGTQEEPEVDKPSSYSWSSDWYQSVKSVIITPADDTNACHTWWCMYYIGVHGFYTNSTFTIVASSEKAVMPLIPNAPQRHHVDAHQWQYFSARNDMPGYDLSIVCTAISGDPDIYVSRTVRYPNQTNFEKASTRWGADTVDYDNAPVGVYYIGVYAFEDSTFSIQALETPVGNDKATVITLYDGVPTSSVLHHGHFRYYSFEVAGEHGDLTITLTNEYGDADLYVNFGADNFPNATYYQWSAQQAGQDHIRINAPAAGTYLIGVFAFGTSSYSLTATAAAATTLVDGQAIYGALDTGEYRYYLLQLDQDNVDLSFSLTTFNGDPDMYISTKYQRPNTTHYEWASADYRDDTIIINTDDEYYCRRCTYYVAVKGWEACSYSILAHYGRLIPLSAGNPQVGHVIHKGFNYYSFTLSPGTNVSDITITVTPTLGTPQLYVGNKLDSKPTTAGNWIWRSDVWSGATIEILESDPNFGLTYIIGVYGVTTCDYSIVVTAAAQHVVLRPGVPVRDTVYAGQYTYFKIKTLKGGDEMNIIVTAINGDPDVYASIHFAKPNQEDSEWSSRQWGDDSIYIASTEIATYYISVQGFITSTFTITATITNVNTTHTTVLVDGIPQNGWLDAGYYDYFHFFVPASQADETGELIPVAHVDFSVTRRAGDPDLYITNDGNLPNTTYYQWSSAAWGQDVVSINYPRAGEYILAVYAFSPTSYTIVASTAENIQTLSVGIPYSATLRQNRYQYFQFPVNTIGKALTVTVTSYNGDPDLFMSTITNKPNLNNYTWAARSFYEDSITIPADEVIRGRTYYIGVQAYTNCSFTIVVNLESPTLLLDGQPQRASIAVKEAMLYYDFMIDGVHDVPDYLTFTVSPFIGAVYLFVSSGEHYPTINDPNSYNWVSWTFEGPQTINVARHDAKFCPHMSGFNECFFKIGVYAVSSSTSYSILAQTAGQSVQLINGQPQQSWISTGKYGYFFFQNDLQLAAVAITVTPIAGDPDLFMSATNERPTREQYTWSAQQWGADTIYVDSSDAGFVYKHDNVPGIFYISVYAWENTTFTITATVMDLKDLNSTATTILYNGQPQTGFLPGSNVKHYYDFFVPAGAGKDVTITATPRYGDPDIYVRNDATLPTPQNAQWSAANWGEDRVYIPASEGCPNGGCLYKILVNSYDSSTLYSITASTSDAATLLQDGVSFQGQLERGQVHYFSYYANDYAPVLDITCVGLVGDPDIFVDMKNQRPNSTTNSRWNSRDSGSDGLEILWPDTGRYFIGVVAWTRTTYVLTASLGHITLADGRPFTNVVSQYRTQYYAFHVNNPTKAGEISFSVITEDAGDCVMWIATESYVAAYDYQPSSTRNQWNSDSASGSSIRNVVVLPNDDVNVCWNCTYIIAVQSRMWRLTYTITATDGQNGVMIFPGRPTGTAAVSQGSFKYYRTIIDTTDYDVSISLTSYNGEMELMYGDVSKLTVNTSRAHTRIQSGTRGGQLFITKDKITPGMAVYVAVYGYQQSTYSLVVATGATMLYPGVPTTTSIPWGAGAVYFFFQNAAAQAQDIVVTISPVDDFASAKFNVYISANASNTKPDQDNWNWKYIGMGLGDLLQILRTDPRYVGNSTYYFAVSSSTQGAEFSITVSTQDAVDTIFNNVDTPSKGNVAFGQYKYYSIYVDSAQNFTLTLESCTGNADLYVAQKHFLPKEGQTDWRSGNFDKADVVKVADPKITGTTFYIGVLGNKQADQAADVRSSYELLARPTSEAQPVVGDDGKIYPSTPTDAAGKIQLSFGTATAAGTDGQKLVYRIFYSARGSGAVMYSYCGVKAGMQATIPTVFEVKEVAKANADEIATGRMSRTIAGLKESGEYTVSVMVATSADDATSLKTFYSLQYTTASKDGGSSGGGVPTGIILGVGIPGALLIGIIIIGLVMKNRKLTKELEVEMHDVPKSAVRKAVRGPDTTGGEEKQAGKQTKSYSRLLTDDDPDDYAPPATDADGAGADQL